ncbi:MAG TPA: glycosyltransferase family 4 protein [Lacipirellulaceae bacterium]
MAASQTSANTRPELWALGPLPPPVTGMTLLTERILQRLMRAGAVTVFNWSPGGPQRRFGWRIKRLLRTFGCLISLLKHGPVRAARLYIVAGSKAGLLMTGLLANAGRLLGYRVYVHHHTYYYLDHYDWRMAWIDRSLGPRGVHVVHCQQMADDFRAKYVSQRRFEFVLPSVFALPLREARHSTPKPFRLGHMGNLSVAKGLDLVLETMRALERRGRSVELRLAGPFQTGEAKRMVQRAIQENPGAIDYIGPVYDEAKDDYFTSIDCFLFPSRSESWGIVLNEAMAAGVPVLACRRGCTSTLVGDGAGVVVDGDKTFVEVAVDRIISWMDNPDQYRAASRAAIQQADCLNKRGQLELDRFVDSMFAPLSESS